MKLLAIVVMLLCCCISHVVSGSQLTHKTDLLASYKQLLSLRNAGSTLLKGGDGVMVTKTVVDSKFKVNDLLLSINNRPINSTANLMQYIAGKDQQDDLYSVTLNRDGKIVEVSAIPADFHVFLSDMNPIEVSEMFDQRYSNIDNTRKVKSEHQMIRQYLKGRPVRTPNNILN